MNTSKNISDQVIRESVVDPAGGLDRFRLLVCPGFKLIQYADEDGDFLDLAIEDDDLASATVSFLERCGVPEVVRSI